MLRRLATLLAEEPYRLFFPFGIIAGILGVALWPLWLAGWIEAYPGPAHVRLMTEGFFTAFILGFLGTAGPRMLDARPLPPLGWLVIGGLWLAAQGASLVGFADAAEALFVGALALFLGFLGRRWGQREGLPPPGFVLVVASLLLALGAAATQTGWLQRSFPGAPFGIWVGGRQYLAETYLLFPILGAAPFFLGRFGGLPPAHRSLDQARPDAVWRRQAWLCLGTGGLLLAATGLKASGEARAGALLQGATTFLFVLTQVPWRYPRPVPTLARIVQFALLCLVVAPLAEAIWPADRLAWRHLLVIPGFQGVVVGVATWVVFAHAGHRARCLRPWPALGGCALAGILATASRMAAEWNPAIRDAHLLYAALLWVAASAVWLGLLLPRLREQD